MSPGLGDLPYTGPGIPYSSHPGASGFGSLCSSRELYCQGHISDQGPGCLFAAQTDSEPSVLEEVLHNQCMKAPDSGLGSHLVSLLWRCPVARSSGRGSKQTRVQFLDLSLPTCVTLDNVPDSVPFPVKWEWCYQRPRVP